MSKVLAFTIVYPQAEKYIPDFIESLRCQTFKDYDVLIVNDGCDSTMLAENFKYFNAFILDTNLSPSKNREVGIKYAYDNRYDVLIFCDIDDWFFNERFAASIKLLKKSDIVVNNLNIVNEARKSLCDRYFSYSLVDGERIDSLFLKQKNLLGLSNTAIRVSENILVDLPSEISIGDWYYFTICAERGLTITYCDDALTDYRQHSNNLIGIDDFSVELFQKLIKLKIEHYWYLSKLFPDYNILYENARDMEDLSDEEISILINKNKLINAHPLWWENIRK